MIRGVSSPVSEAPVRPLIEAGPPNLLVKAAFVTWMPAVRREALRCIPDAVGRNWRDVLGLPG
jgi:hypothetical protein